MKRERWQEPVRTQIHGRIVVDTPVTSQAPWLVGFHGYGETADLNLEQMQSIPGSHEWVLCAIQSLHLFYNSKSREVVGSWMTRQQRLLAIEDNLAYVHGALERLSQRIGPPPCLVLLGFSQGAAMAYRAAAESPGRAQGLVILAGDVPPDVADRRPGSLPSVLLGRGSQDRWYTSEKLDSDLSTLQHLRTPVDVCRFQGGHEWSDSFRQAAARFLRERRGAAECQPPA